MVCNKFNRMQITTYFRKSILSNDTERIQLSILFDIGTFRSFSVSFDSPRLFIRLIFKFAWNQSVFSFVLQFYYWIFSRSFDFPWKILIGEAFYHRVICWMCKSFRFWNPRETDRDMISCWIQIHTEKTKFESFFFVKMQNVNRFCVKKGTTKKSLEKLWFKRRFHSFCNLTDVSIC